MPQLFILAAACALTMGIGACSSSRQALPEQQLTSELAAIVQDPVYGIPSLSVLAIRDGKVSYSGQFGMRSMAAQQGADADTMYRIASISKLVTTLGVMRLVEEGKLNLDADVSTYLGFLLRNPAFPDQPISLRMLLSHTSSLRDGGGYSWNAATSLGDAFGRAEGKWEASTRPGAHFAYSNLNFGVVGTIMEAASGERFDRLMQRLVLDPLGLRGGYNPSGLPREQWRTIATLYRKRAPDASTWNPAGPWIAQVDDYSARAPAPPAGLESYIPGRNGTLFSPTGGLRMSAADLGKIMLMLMDGGRFEGRAFLKPSSVAAMLSHQWRFDAGRPNGDTHHNLFTEWGLGVQHFESKPGRGSNLIAGGGFAASGHLGEAYGLLSVFAFDPVRRHGMVVLIGGTVQEPSSIPGKYSALSRHEELVLTALYRHLGPLQQEKR